MRNRLFLLVLVAILLLIQGLLRSAAQATPLSGGTTLAGFSFWELRGALPLGIYAAGLFFTSTSAAALSIHAILRIRQHRSRLTRNTNILATALLWCGLPTICCCYHSLTYIFAWSGCYDPTSWQTFQHLEWSLYGSPLLVALGLLVCRLGQAGAWAAFLFSSVHLLILGQIGYGTPLILFPSAIMSASGFLMGMGKGKFWAAIPLLTAICMNGALAWLHASPAATLPIAGSIYGIALLILTVPLCLKIRTQQG